MEKLIFLANSSLCSLILTKNFFEENISFFLNLSSYLNGSQVSNQ
jgi:hypothetical protein